MTISSRYLSYLALILSAGFLAVATQAFAPVTVAWLTFAIAIWAAALGMLAIFGSDTGLRIGIPRRRSSTTSRSTNVLHTVLGGLVCVLSAWTIVASLVFAPPAVLWLGFAAAAAYVGLGAVGLTIHELTTENVVHSLEIERARAGTLHE